MIKFHIIGIITLLGVTGCNTMAGLGRDVAYAGNSVVKWSTDMREEIPSTGYVAEDANKLVITDANGNVVGKVDAKQPPPAQPVSSPVSSNAADSATIRASELQAETEPTSGGFNDSAGDRMNYHKPRYYQYQGTR